MNTLEHYKNIWVYAETFDGTIRNVGLELLNPGKELASKLGEKLVAVLIGDNISKWTKELFAHGADEVIIVEGPEYTHYNTDGYTNVLEKLVDKFKPSGLLIGATNNGRDLGPRLACRLKTGLTADCTELDIDEETGNIAWTRPAFGGNLMATILCEDNRPQIGTVRPSVFKKMEPDYTKQGIIHVEKIKTPVEDIRTKLLEYIKADNQEKVNLEEAEIIVSGGRGLGKPENFELIRNLAQVLGGTVAASRAVVDAGWIDQVYQVGQTGKTVGPKVYIACGISGAIQHTAGMSSSDIIIAINKDPDAPIFNISDLGIVGDVFEIIPMLTEEIKKMKGTH